MNAFLGSGRGGAPGAPPSEVLDPLRPFTEDGDPDTAVSAGEAIAAMYDGPSWRWRAPRGEWARAYRRDQATFARNLRVARCYGRARRERRDVRDAAYSQSNPRRGGASDGTPNP